MPGRAIKELRATVYGHLETDPHRDDYGGQRFEIEKERCVASCNTVYVIQSIPYTVYLTGRCTYTTHRFRAYAVIRRLWVEYYYHTFGKYSWLARGCKTRAERRGCVCVRGRHRRNGDGHMQSREREQDPVGDSLFEGCGACCNHGTCAALSTSNFRV